jgi:hypothetical protein
MATNIVENRCRQQLVRSGALPQFSPNSVDDMPARREKNWRPRPVASAVTGFGTGGGIRRPAGQASAKVSREATPMWASRNSSRQLCQVARPRGVAPSAAPAGAPPQFPAQAFQRRHGIARASLRTRFRRCGNRAVGNRRRTMARQCSGAASGTTQWRGWRNQSTPPRKLARNLLGQTQVAEWIGRGYRRGYRAVHSPAASP